MKRSILAALLVLMLLATSCGVIGAGTKSNEKSVILQATEDAYLVTDVSTTDDPQGLRDQNFGSQDFIKVWYAWKVIKDEQAVSLGLFKFDLKPIKNRDVKSATLQLLASRVDFNQPVRLVDVSLVDGKWSEKDVTFNTRPSWGTSIIATNAVYGAGVWYSWDVTASVVQKAKEGEVSYATGLSTMEETKEEQVLFAAHQVTNYAPRLIVTYLAPPFTLPWWVWIAVIVVVAAMVFFISQRLPPRRRSAPGA